MKNQFLIALAALLKDKNVFKCFQLANTAMLIQMILSNDNSFGSKAKELSETMNDEEMMEVMNALEQIGNQTIH